MCGLLLSTAVAVAPPALASEVSGSTPVSTTTMTFVDTSRSTPPWDGMPARPSRTLVTSIWYPAQSGSADKVGQGPYPLIVFAHGLGGSPQDYQALLTAWAAAGYVVAAPLFPLSSSETPGGPDGGDIGNQPGDMSFVIGQMLKASTSPSGPLSGLIEPDEIGAAGHSNGAITTLGLVANSCCRDTRVKAAVVMAGTTEGLGRGHYDLAEAPPLLVVAGPPRWTRPLRRCGRRLQPGARAQGPPRTDVGTHRRTPRVRQPTWPRRGWSDPHRLPS